MNGRQTVETIKMRSSEEEQKLMELMERKKNLKEESTFIDHTHTHTKVGQGNAQFELRDVEKKERKKRQKFNI